MSDAYDRALKGVRQVFGLDDEEETEGGSVATQAASPTPSAPSVRPPAVEGTGGAFPAPDGSSPAAPAEPEKPADPAAQSQQSPDAPQPPKTSPVASSDLPAASKPMARGGAPTATGPEVGGQALAASVEEDDDEDGGELEVTMDTEETPRVAFAFQEASWESPPLLARRLADAMRGGPHARHANWLDYALDRWGGRLPRRPLSALVLGCVKHPPLVEMLRVHPRVGAVTVVDNDAVPLENLADHDYDDVDCWQLDLNTDRLPEGDYDIALCWDRLHHLRELEFVIDEVRARLPRGGLLIGREYVGPNRMQYDQDHMRLVNGLLGRIPEALREERGGIIRRMQRAPELGMLMRRDPTRAVRAESVRAVLEERLRVIETVPLGGALLAPLLAGIARNFADEKPEGDRVLEAMIAIEERLMEVGLLANHYLFYVARKD